MTEYNLLILYAYYIMISGHHKKELDNNIMKSYHKVCPNCCVGFNRMWYDISFTGDFLINGNIRCKYCKKEYRCDNRLLQYSIAKFNIGNLNNENDNKPEYTIGIDIGTGKSYSVCQNVIVD